VCIVLIGRSFRLILPEEQKQNQHLPSSAHASEQPAPALDEVEVPVSPSNPEPVTLRSVTLKFFKLKEHEQRRVIVQLELDDAGDHNLKDYELAISAVRRSEERGRLPELDAKIDAVIASHG
jgi:hypothetical protein